MILAYILVSICGLLGNGRFTQLYTSRAKPTGIADAELQLPLYARQVTMEMKGGAKLRYGYSRAMRSFLITTVRYLLG